MSQNLDKRICLLVDCLATGGAEKAAARLSVALEEMGCTVYIVSIVNEVGYTHAGTFVPLRSRYTTFKPLRILQKAWALKKHLKLINPDGVIDFRMRRVFITEYLLYTLALNHYKMVYRVNSHYIDWHIPKGSFFKNIYSQSKVVAVSEEIRNRLISEYGITNVSYIPNFCEETKMVSEPFQTDSEYIIAVGSLRNSVKQFDELIKTYAASKLPAAQVQLFILGKGEDEAALKHLVTTLHMDAFVKLLGYQPQPEKYMLGAKYLVLCSRMEGFPNVILEALQLGIPVVSFNCKSGPSEMIVHGRNGLLVKDQDFTELQKAMEDLLFNKQLYNVCKTNAHCTLDRFSKETVLNKWNNIISE